MPVWIPRHHAGASLIRTNGTYLRAHSSVRTSVKISILKFASRVRRHRFYLAPFSPNPPGFSFLSLLLLFFRFFFFARSLHAIPYCNYCILWYFVYDRIPCDNCCQRRRAEYDAYGWPCGAEAHDAAVRNAIRFGIVIFIFRTQSNCTHTCTRAAWVETKNLLSVRKLLKHYCSPV